jgi:hypothetical protein
MNNEKAINAIFGDNAEALEDVFPKRPEQRSYWLGDQGVLPHFHHVDGETYTSGKDAVHSRLRITSFLVNRWTDKPRTIYVFDKAGIQGDTFAEVLAEHARKASSSKSLVHQLNNTKLADVIIDELIPSRGVSGNDKFLSAASVANATVKACSREKVPAEDVPVLTAVFVAMMNDNGYVADFEDMKKVVVSKERMVNLKMFERAYLSDYVAMKMRNSSLKFQTATYMSSGSDSRHRFTPNMIKTEAYRVLSDLAITFRKAVSQRRKLHTALIYALAMARGYVEQVPESAQDTSLQLASCFNLLDFATQLPDASPTVEGWEAATAVEDVVSFLTRSSIIAMVTASELASSVNVRQTLSEKTGFVQSTLMTTAFQRTAAREIHYNAGDLAGYSKLWVEPEVQDAIDALLPGDATVLPRDKCQAVLESVITQTMLANRVVLDFTSMNQYDRDLLAHAVAMTRATRVSMIGAPTGGGSKSGLVLVYYVVPTRQLEGVEKQVNLNDEFRTIDPREAIAMTGEQESRTLLAGYDCTLRLDSSSVNYIDLQDADEFLMTLDQPLYATVIETDLRDDDQERRSIRFQTTPLRMVNMEDLDHVYSSFSLTNRHDDALILRMFMAANLLLELQSVIDKDQHGLATMKQIMSTVVMEQMIEITNNNAAADFAVKQLVREYANAHNVTRSFAKFYADERLMLNLRMYVATVLLMHLGGLNRDETEGLHHIVTDTDALATIIGTKLLTSITKIQGRI